MRPLNRPAKGFRLLPADMPLLDKLPADRAEMLKLCDIESKTYEQISHKLRCPVGTVRSGIHKARLRIWALRQSCGGHPVQTS